MSVRSELDKAILAAATANRQNAGKWHDTYEAFDDQLSVTTGVAGKLLTQEKQLANRIQKELARENPYYVVLCALPEVRNEMVRKHLAAANLPSARCALIVRYDDTKGTLEPFELQVYQHDHIADALADAYGLAQTKVVREESVGDMSSGTGGTGGTGGHVTPMTVVPMVIDDRVRRALRLAVMTTSAVLLVGPPGTGKTALLRELLNDVEAEPGAFGLSQDLKPAVWTTPEESWGTRELVGGETVAEDDRLRFREGHVLRAIREDRWLVLDEANRADMDKIFGGLLTWLSNQEVELGVASTVANAPPVMLGWADTPDSTVENVEELSLDLEEEDHGSDPVRYLAGSEWRLLGTYNALDAQRVFRFGQALGRRFVRVPIPPATPAQFEIAADPLLIDLPATIRTRVPALYAAHWADDGTQLGPALFMRIPDYIKAGSLLEDETADEPEDDETVGDGGAATTTYVDKLLSEAYLINVGAFLARYEPDQLAALAARIVDSGAMSEPEWLWVVAMSQHLG